MWKKVSVIMWLSHTCTAGPIIKDTVNLEYLTSVIYIIIFCQTCGINMCFYINLNYLSMTATSTIDNECDPNGKGQWCFDNVTGLLTDWISHWMVKIWITFSFLVSICSFINIH